jgi:hypothetical protein
MLLSKVDRSATSNSSASAWERTEPFMELSRRERGYEGYEVLVRLAVVAYPA